MRKRVPVPRDERPPLPEFTPVPRKYRHDGWTPERQKAFIEALADCGSVSRAAAQVNMAQANCYTLRRSPGAESFRRAWDAALDFGVLRLKDVAFERAIQGQLHPVFVNGKLKGFHRKTNDALLMFCLRHYGEDANGKRTTINYFSTRATAGAAVAADGPTPDPSREREGSLSHAEASTTTVRTVINESGAPGSGGERLDEAARVLGGFEGVALDTEAAAAIQAALEACAARARAAADAVGEEGADWAEADPGEPFVSLPHNGAEYRGALEPPLGVEEWVPFTPGEGRGSRPARTCPTGRRPRRSRRSRRAGARTRRRLARRRLLAAASLGRARGERGRAGRALTARGGYALRQLGRCPGPRKSR